MLEILGNILCLEQSPCCFLPYAHQQEHVNSIILMNNGKTLQYSLGHPCHGDTILGISWCEIYTLGSSLLLSGSNDCTVKMSLNRNGSIKKSSSSSSKRSKRKFNLPTASIINENINLFDRTGDTSTGNFALLCSSGITTAASVTTFSISDQCHQHQQLHYYCILESNINFSH